ncbi:Glucoamylase precursor [Aquisphaera giovannonii]|uniref:Glucoamylase n=1 Tax=Aquisphaera giovannonii TaxID=406548 RepID=A0A5B9WDH9_9BACT|nr:glycoside hydrolase family 15 protein [Aquisphaera giovannonii]QEH38011.1 Glucoamylase precursor [Aquisphaera giovannonii]
MDVPAGLAGSGRAWGRNEDDASRRAPGWPGDPPRWTTAAKQGIGTAAANPPHGTNLAWFTLACGALTEVYYPRVDSAVLRSLGLVVTGPGGFASDERRDASHRLEPPADGVPIYRLENACRSGRYRIRKEIFTHPDHDAVIQRTEFEPLHGGAAGYRVFVVLEPHSGGEGEGASVWLGDARGIPLLMADAPGGSLALACSSPWGEATAGFAGTSDPREVLAERGRLSRRFEAAGPGNVVLAAEIDFASRGGDFVLALGLGRDPDEAGHRALATLRLPMEEARRRYVRGWRDWHAAITPPPVPEGVRDLSRISAMVLAAHTGRVVSGATVASLSVPWGEARAGDEEGYHLVWPRDLCEVAGGFLAVGAKAEAARALRYLEAIQGADGHWPQNMYVSGAPYWEAVQLGQTAIVLVLLDHLRRDGAIDEAEVARLWPTARRAAAYIVQCGPSTQEDRWENERGYTPFTLALVISALLIAADLADERGEPAAGAYLRASADAWNASIEDWLYVSGTGLARSMDVDGYYARIIAGGGDVRVSDVEGGAETNIPTSLDREFAPDEVVSPDALALVRFGLRAPDDPRILNTIKVVDALLKVETAHGPVWRRYNGDGYGEHADGTPYDGHTRGVGRPWPLLTGERAHYELAAGRRGEAVRLLSAMAAFANDGGMIPEQVWDADDIPEKGLFRGRPSGSAMPLAWAHAEYLKLCRSIRDGRIFDMPPRTARRYLEEKVRSDKALWRPEHRREFIPAGATLRIELPSPAVIRWTHDAGPLARQQATRDTTLGVHVADLPTAALAPGSVIRLSIEQGGEEGDEARVVVEEAAGAGRGS